MCTTLPYTVVVADRASWGASSSSKRVRRVVPQARVIEQLISARRSSIASLSQSKAIEDFIAEVAKDRGVGDFYGPLYCCFITRFTRACRHDRDPVLVRKRRVTVGDHPVCGVLFRSIRCRCSITRNDYRRQFTEKLQRLDVAGGPSRHFLICCRDNIHQPCLRADRNK